MKEMDEGSASPTSGMRATARPRSRGRQAGPGSAMRCTRIPHDGRGQQRHHRSPARVPGESRQDPARAAPAPHPAGRLAPLRRRLIRGCNISIPQPRTSEESGECSSQYRWERIPPPVAISSSETCTGSSRRWSVCWPKSSSRPSTTASSHWAIWSTAGREASTRLHGWRPGALR